MCLYVYNMQNLVTSWSAFLPFNPDILRSFPQSYCRGEGHKFTANDVTGS